MGYSFAKCFNGASHNIYANELDTVQFEALTHNMNVFGDSDSSDIHSDNVHLSNEDFLHLHSVLGETVCAAMDGVFLDPEWNNGDDYKQTDRGQIHLFDIGGVHLYEVVQRVL